MEEDKYNWEMTTEDKKEGDHGPDGHVVNGFDHKNCQSTEPGIELNIGTQSMQVDFFKRQ